MAEHQVEETRQLALTAYKRETKEKGREGGGEEEWGDKVLRDILCHNCIACRP